MKRLVGCIVGLLILSACAPTAAELNNQANELVQTGDYDEAIRSYQLAQVSEPENGLLYFNASYALAQTDQLVDAIAALDQAIVRGDNQIIANANYNLGNIYFQQANYEQAVVSYREALLANPMHDDARFNLELALLQIQPPTPTPMEMQVRPEQDNADPDAQPTPDPAAEQPPEPTPTPPDALADPGPSPMFQGDDDEGTESDSDEDAPTVENENAEEKTEEEINDALQLLEPIESNQDRVTTFRDDYSFQEDGTPEYNKDW